MESTLQLTTWNILNPQYAKPERYANSTLLWLDWKGGRRDRLLNLTPGFGSQIYCLQESTQDAAEAVLDALPRRYKLVWRPRKPHWDDGCATLYDGERLEALLVTTQQIDPSHILLSILFKDLRSDAIFWCCNTHIAWETRNQNLMALLPRLDSINLACEKRYIHPHALILCGDFNAERDEEWYRAVPLAHFVDPWEGAHGFTFSNGLQRNKWIDYVLVHGNIKPVTQRIELAGLCTTLPSAQVPSDHLPLTLTFNIVQ
jgi:endonuclease/exonuclease/phosphatase family metal-dependent hydrolase